MKKTLSIILSFVMIITALSALPFSAFADDYGVWVGGTQVTNTNAEDVFGDGTVSYNNATKTLTLKDADIQTGIEAFGGKIAVYTTDDLAVIGYGTIGGGDIRYGIFVYGGNNLTLNGDFTITGTAQGVYKYNGGNLLIKGGNIKTTGEVKGIAVSDGDITINGGNVIATGNGATKAYGYGVSGNTLTVNGGSLTANGGINGNPGQGISVDSLNINGGRVTAVGNDGALYASPTLGSNATAFGSYNMSSLGAVSYDASQNGNYKWFQATCAENFDFYAVGDCFSWGFTPGNADGGLRNNGDGTYSRTFTATKAVEKAMLKVTDGASQWYGDELGRNYTFTITGAGEFTVTYYSATHKVSVSGDIVAEYVLPVSTVTAIGTGKNNFLNDKGWTFSDDNKLSEVSTGVWEITYDNVGADSYEFKFAIDGSWTSNFGAESSTAAVSGVAQNAKYNADSNIAFNVNSDDSTVMLQLDLSNYKYSTDSGAKFTVTVVEPVSPEPTFTVTYNFNGGTRNGQSTFVRQEYAFAPDISVANFIDTMGVTPPAGKELDAIEINGTRYELGSSYLLNQDTTYKYIWKSTAAPIVPHKHKLKKVAKKAATTSKAGNKTYYTCSCGKWFWDSKGTKQIKNKKDVVIPKIVLSEADKKLPTESSTESLIKKTNTDKKDVKGSEFATLKLKATGKKKAVALSWKKVKNADGYIIYGSPCGKNNKMKKLKIIKSAKTVKYTDKKLKKGKFYKYIVVAYKTTADGKKRILSKSKTVHCVTNGGKKGNAEKVILKESKLTVKKGKTAKISGRVRNNKPSDKHIAVARFESSNTKIATVDEKGNVKGIKKGTATIYVVAQNGVYTTAKVTVK